MEPATIHITHSRHASRSHGGKLLLLAPALARLLLALTLLTPTLLKSQGDLRTHVFTRLQAWRAEQGLPAFTRDAGLDVAAQLQAEWCARVDSLSHTQSRKGKATLKQRVALGRGTHDLLSEVLVTFQPHAGRPAAEWAQQALDQCAVLPENAAAVADSMNLFVGVGLMHDRKTDRIYAAIVLARARWVPPAGVVLNRRAFRIRSSPKNGCPQVQKNAALAHRIALGFGPDTFREREDSVPPRHDVMAYGYSHYPTARAFLRQRTKMAPDVIFRDQFPCDSANQLHGSPYHDGYLLHPRGGFYTWLFHDRDIVHDILSMRSHRIPLLPRDSIQVNGVLTQKRNFCSYHIPFSIPVGKLPTTQYTFAPDTIPFGGSGVKSVRVKREFKVTFEKSRVVPSPTDMAPLLDTLAVPGRELVQLRIKGYASVEGTLEINRDLYSRRAEAIKNAVQATQAQPVRMTSTAAENWADLKRDLKGTPWAPLLRLSNERLRDTLQRDKALLAALEPTLARHRYASVEVEYRLQLAQTQWTNQQLRDSLAQALDQQQYPAAHAVQSELWRRTQTGDFAQDSFIHLYIPAVEQALPMLHNIACMRERMGLQRLDDSSRPLFNQSKTYPWMEARQVLALSLQCLHPHAPLPFPYWHLKRIQALKRRKLPDDFIRTVELNYYMGLCQYQGAMGGVDKRTVRDVVVRYAGDEVDLQEATDLALFLARCGAIDESIKLVRPHLQRQDLPEDLVFFYAWAGLHEPTLIPEADMLAWMQRAHARNPQRWQAQVSHDWQLLRWPALKALYCNCAPAATAPTDSLPADSLHGGHPRP